MAQKIVFVAGLDYPKKDGKPTGYITKEKQADYLKKGFPRAEITTFGYGAKNTDVKKAIGTDASVIVVLFSAGCQKAKEISAYFSLKKLPLANIHLNEPYTCDSGVLSTINSAKANGVPKENVYTGGTDCTGQNVEGATVLSERTSHNQSLEPLGKLLEQKYPEVPPVDKKEEEKKEEKVVEDPNQVKTEEVKTEVKTETNTDKDVAEAKKKEEQQIPQEKKIVEDGYIIADGEYTFELEDEETWSVVGPNGFAVTWPDGTIATLGVMYRTAMPDLVPTNDVTKSEDVKKEETTSSQDGGKELNSEEDKKEIQKIKDNKIPTNGDFDRVVLSILDPKTENDKKVTGSVTFKKLGPKLTAVGHLEGFPDGGVIDWEGEEASMSQKDGLVREMIVILQNMVENKYNVAIKLVSTH